MKAPPFRYVKPATVSECLTLLAGHGDDAQILAGGQSLVPMLNLRLARPAVLIDINAIAELAEIAEDADGIYIGAMTRHASILASEIVRRRLPLLKQAGRHIGHVAIRSRGTLGGSLSLADPASEWPACVLALAAEIELASAARGVRRVPASDFFQGVYATARHPDELLTRVIFRTARTGAIQAFDEIARRHGDFAMAGLAVNADAVTPRVHGLRMALLGVADRPVLAVGAMLALEGKPLDASQIAAAVAALRREIDPPDDPACPAAYRRHIAGILLESVLRELQQEARMAADDNLRIALSVNGERVQAEVPARLHLADFLRQRLGLTGTHIGCEHGSCGACTVLVDGALARGCLMLAVQADGATVETIEGAVAAGRLARLTDAFHRRNALQCGFCTPAMLLTAAELLRRTPKPSREEVREWLSGNFCRCTGYQSIVDAVLEAVE